MSHQHRWQESVIDEWRLWCACGAVKNRGLEAVAPLTAQQAVNALAHKNPNVYLPSAERGDSA